MSEGNKALLVGLAAREQISLVSQAMPYLNAVCDQFNETVQLRIRDGLESVSIAAVESTQDMRVVTKIGRRRPLQGGSSGKLFLAFGPEDIRQAVLAGTLQRYTAHTIVQRSKLTQELAKIRAQGYSTSNAELTDDILSVATPVRDATGQVIAALSLSAPVQRGLELMPKFVVAMVAAAERLSTDLGWRAGVNDASRRTTGARAA